MRAFLIALALGLAALAWLAGMLAKPANAQEVTCAPAQSMAQIDIGMLTQHGELPRAMGLTAAGFLIRVYVGPNGTWSMVQIAPDGTACMVAFGTAMELMPLPGVLN